LSGHRLSRKGLSFIVSILARATVIAIEDQIRGQRDFEIGVFIDTAGLELVRFQGGINKVGVALAWLEKMRGNTFTHNHPGGMPLSLDDLELTAKFRLGEIRAVTRHFRFAATGLDKVWHGALAAAYHDAVSPAAQKVMAMVRSDQVHRANFQSELQHQILRAVAGQLNFDYWRERS
jgi:hypothetical protein